GGSRTVQVTQPDGSYYLSTFSYGRLSSIARYNSAGTRITQTSSAYDNHGRLWKSTDVRNGTTTNLYNNADLVSTTYSPVTGSGQPSQTRAIDYTTMGRQSKVTEADGGIVYTRYYKNGLLKLTWGART